MSVATAHQLSRYYDYYRDKEIIFTKANLQSLHMDPRQIYIKCNGAQWPCIINSSSLQMAKVLLGTSSGLYVDLQKKRDLTLSIKYCFLDADGSPIQFFVNCNVVDIKPYQSTSELAIITLFFTQRPPDDLIFRLGQFIEVNENFKNRKEERISINEKSLRNLGIQKEETVIFIADVPRRCILKDLSFGGARVMLVGIPKFLVNKSISLMLLFFETNEKIKLTGQIINADFLPGRKDIAVVHIAFDEDEIPMSYKFYVNNYITSYQKQMIENQIINQENEEKAKAAAAEKSEQRFSEIAAAVQKSKEQEAKLEAQRQAAKIDKETNAFVKSTLNEKK